MDVGEAASDVASKDDIATPTPADPLRGLPQLFRQRGFSSDFSEDGELGSGSRRNSTSEGMVTTPTQFAMPDVQPTQQGSERPLIRTSTPEGEIAAEDDEGATERALIGSFVRTFMGSSEGKAMRVTKGADNKPSEGQVEASEDVFAEAPSREGGKHGKRSPVGKGSVGKKTVKLVPSSKLPEPVLTSPPQPGRDATLPPPLRLMSPLSEPIILGSQGQHPRSLSPVSCSPRGQGMHFGLPKLSPLHPPPLSPLHPPPLSPLHPPSMSPMHPPSLHQPPQLTPRPDIAETTSFPPNSAHPPIYPPSYPPAISTHSLHAAPTATIVAAIPVSPPTRLSRTSESDGEWEPLPRVSPSPSPEKTVPPPAELQPEEDTGIAEEVATLDSGVGGDGGGVVRDEVIFDDIGHEDDIVQTVVSRMSPVSDDDIVQSSARRPSQGESPSDGDEDIVQASSHVQKGSPSDNEATVQMAVRRTPSDDNIVQPSSRDHSGGMASPEVVRSVSPPAGGVAPPVVSAEVLEVLEQTFSSDESDDSESEESEKEESVNGVGGGGVAVKGVESIVQEERSRVVEDVPPKMIVSREKVSYRFSKGPVAPDYVGPPAISDCFNVNTDC